MLGSLDMQELHDLSIKLLRIMQSGRKSAHTKYTDYVDAPDGKCYRITINLELVDKGDSWQKR